MSAGPGGSYGSESFRTWEWDPPPFRKDESSRREGEKSTTADLLSKHAVLKRDYRFCTRPVPLYDDEEEKPDRACKEDHFQRETGDAETAIGGISP